MKLHTLLKRGDAHKDFCEDFLFTYNLNEKYFIAGVFDGCSSGENSQFASNLFAKIFKSECFKIKIRDYRLDIKELMKDLLKNFIIQLDSIKKKLNLETKELLSTIILMIFDKKKNEIFTMTIGDGVISCNGELEIFDQNNTPNYLAYHLDKLTTDYYDIWFAEFDQSRYFTDIKDFSISSDGILSFVNISSNLEDNEKPCISPESYLLNDNFLIKNKAMLSRKFNILKNKHQLSNYDDLGIVRIILD